MIWCTKPAVVAFANAVGMAFFHAAEFLETQKIAVDDSQAPYPYFYLLTQPEVRTATYCHH